MNPAHILTLPPTAFAGAWRARVGGMSRVLPRSLPSSLPRILH